MQPSPGACCLFEPKGLKMAQVTGSLLAKSRQLWPVSLHIVIFREEENDPGFCFAVCGGDGAGGCRPCPSPGTWLFRNLRWRPQFRGRRLLRVRPDPAFDRE